MRKPITLDNETMTAFAEQYEKSSYATKIGGDYKPEEVAANPDLYGIAAHIALENFKKNDDVHNNLVIVSLCHAVKEKTGRKGDVRRTKERLERVLAQGNFK